MLIENLNSSNSCLFAIEDSIGIFFSRSIRILKQQWRSSEHTTKTIAKIKWLIFLLGWMVSHLVRKLKIIFSTYCMLCPCEGLCECIPFFNIIYKYFPLLFNWFLDPFVLQLVICRKGKKIRHYYSLKKKVNRKEEPPWLKNQIRVYSRCNIRKIENVYIIFLVAFKMSNWSETSWIFRIEKEKFLRCVKLFRIHLYTLACIHYQSDMHTHALIN